ncbi:MAG: hypothetical protein E7332_08240 [Clostridiales bacterium]|nr:hypothetical protein [Clostridiales bacterium]
MSFVLSFQTGIENTFRTTAVELAAARMMRDITMTLNDSDLSKNKIRLSFAEMEKEAYRISVSEKEILIEASSDLGFIYALNFISEEFLGIKPFWFFMDQEFIKKDSILIEEKVYFSKTAKIRYRGWFINDEVLFMKWAPLGKKDLPWEMALEALLRCGGNFVIPGTDKNAKLYRPLATAMGLMITHHHAEPLGAEMFARAYPNKKASYAEYPELFHGLWDEAIEAQKDLPVIFNVGFRGQGDSPFWADDPQYDTKEARGRLISELIGLQIEAVKKKVKNPVLCTNIYGEVTELYNEGHISLPDEVIKIWADNGYGKMVSRRQGNITMREPSLPKEAKGAHGSYYHASFYDLQAAAHITPFPNSMQFMKDELQYAYEKGIREFMAVNCSNVRPHVYMLDAIRKFWFDELDAEKHADEFAADYFGGNTEAGELFDRYAACTPKYGENEDDHAGEQFEAYIPRILATTLMRNGIYDKERSAEELLWAIGEKTISEQLAWFKNAILPSEEKFTALFKQAKKTAETLPEKKKHLLLSTIAMQAELRLKGIQGGLLFCDAAEAYLKGDYLDAFILCGKAAIKFEEADQLMRKSEYGIWEGFYLNECLCDIRFSAVVLRELMGYIRAVGNGPEYFRWHREALYPEEDRRIVLLTNVEHRLTDDELLTAFLEKEKNNG